jgi:uncharacterized protein (TIGR02001 family)
MRFGTAISVLALVGASMQAVAQSEPSGVNGYVTLASGYWRTGLPHNDGLSLQLGVDYQHSSGWFVGGWAANVDYDVEYSHEQPREIESSVYGGYHRRQKSWSWTAMAAHYYYPDTAISYDYDELSATFGYRDRLFYSASYSDEYYGSRESSLNQEVSFALPLRGDFELGGALGRFAVSDTKIDYTHWNVGVSKLLARVALDLRYFESGYEGPVYLGDPAANQYVLSVSYALRGRKPRI